MSTTQQPTRSFPFLGILTLIFITLKLTGYIDWSWFWVLSPTILTFSVAGVILTVAAIFLSLASDSKEESLGYYGLALLGLVLTSTFTFGLYAWLG